MRHESDGEPGQVPSEPVAPAESTEAGSADVQTGGSDGATPTVSGTDDGSVLVASLESDADLEGETVALPSLDDAPVPPETESDVSADAVSSIESPVEHPGPAKAPPRSVSELHLKSIIESLVFVSHRPLPANEIAKLARADLKDVKRLLTELQEEYRGRGVQLDELAGGWQFRSAAANAPFVRELLQAKPVRLTRAQVETLAIVAYRQPITRPEIDDIRGVDSGSALKVLLERDLIRMLGRKEEAGRPVLYGTTTGFLEFFGLKSLRELPTLREFTDLTPESEATLVRETGEGSAESTADTEQADASAQTLTESGAAPGGESIQPVANLRAAPGVVEETGDTRTDAPATVDTTTGAKTDEANIREDEAGEP